MNSAQQEDWKFKVIPQVLLALAKNEDLKKVLIFKGALVLNEYLPTGRKSLDIDSNLDQKFLDSHPDLTERGSFLKERLESAISRHFMDQDPVRYELLNLRIEPSPKMYHPLGWDGFLVTVSLRDRQNEGVRGLPKLTIDIASPESLSGRSVTEMDYRGTKIRAYSLERVTGEKARAYLSSLQTYCRKMKRPRKIARVKDLYDLTKIYHSIPISKISFWDIAGNEFRSACGSRYVDCLGSNSFKEGWAETRDAYEKSPVIPRDATFDDVDTSISDIVDHWQRIGIIPFTFPLEREK